MIHYILNYEGGKSIDFHALRPLSGFRVPARARSLNDPARPLANLMSPPFAREARQAGRQRASGGETRWTSAPRPGRAGTILRYDDGGGGRQVRPNAPVRGATSGT